MKERTEVFVIPTHIPWDSLTSKDLEECLFFLTDAMGGKDLQWRVGGKGDGAPDNGRDLEASFFSFDPDNEPRRQTWWIEAKGRSATVEPRVVHEAVLNASGVSTVDVLVIATNSLFSNPTRDWVKNWQLQHPRPIIRLWDKNQLEKLLSQHPTVVARLFAEALSLRGKLELIGSRFWSYGDLPGIKLIEDLWSEKDEKDIRLDAFMAILATELTYGDISKRPWLAILSKDNLLTLLKFALFNAPFLNIRHSQIGHEGSVLAKTVSYICLIALKELSIQEIRSAFSDIFESSKKKIDDFPEHIQDDLKELFLYPMLQQMVNDVFDACTSDCNRVHGPSAFSQQPLSFWERLRNVENDEAPGRISKTDSGGLIIQDNEKPCKINMPFSEEGGCPLVDLVCTEELDIELTLNILKGVIERRLNLLEK